jgi:pimeloyl-ACP methyl ester carboxylesterase
MVLAVAACSSGSGSRSTAGGAATANTSAATANTSPPPEGLPAFYGVPDPLPPGQPGNVVRMERVPAAGLDGTLWRVMYHSRSTSGADIVVTGLIGVPRSAAPSGGYPVVTWAHGTTGIADSCAPSVDPDPFTLLLANRLLDKGYLLTATDYEGLGTPGRHPYLVGVSEARGVLDIVRAARQRPEFHASDRYLVWGHSQGGHAAMFALQIADTYAPELHLVGTVAGAPPSQLALFFPFLRSGPAKFYLLLVGAGFNAAYGDQAAPLAAVLSPAGLADIPDVDQGCTDLLGKRTAGIDGASLVKADPATVPQWAALLKENDPGQFTQPRPEPLLIIQGGKDELVPVASTLALFNQQCRIGQTEQRWIYPGQSHAGVVLVSFGDMLSWIGHRFANQPTPDPMAPTGLPGVTTLRCPA